MRARHLPAVLALAALGPGCALALGVGGDPTIDAKLICDCDQLHAVPNCQANLESRLSGATASDRARWLQGFATGCSTSCDAMLNCYYEAPACVAKGNVCSDKKECCTFHTKPALTFCTNNVCL